MIYIIGDSHVSIFSGVDKGENGNIHMQPEFGYCYTLKLGPIRKPINKFEKNIPYFTAIKIGSHTAYNSYDKLHKIEQVIEEYDIGKNDYIFTCFGQIDVQNHLIPNSVKQKISLDESIKTCIERYLKTLKYLKSEYPDIKIGAYGAVTTSIGCGNTPKISIEESKKYNNITIRFNELLKQKCLENNILFKDISTKLLLPDGMTNNEFVVDDIHLSEKAIPFLIDEFKDLF